MDKLKIGLPDGSLANPERGGLKELLGRARIFTRNYEEGSKIAEITNIPWLEAIVQRPQELPWLAANGYCDVFFCGDDWAREWELRGCKSKKLLGLGIGKVGVVAATKPGNEKLRIAASEYPFIARQYMQQEFAADNVQIVKYGEPITSRYAVIDSSGKTEQKVVYGIADFVIDNTQSGATLRECGLEILEEIFSSECSLYISTKVTGKWKLKKAERIAMMLEGAVNAYGKDLVAFNVTNEKLEAVLGYIRSNKLFGDEETVTRGERMSEVTIEVPTGNKTLPLVDIIGDLKELGATSIDGVPLSYSVRGG